MLSGRRSKDGVKTSLLVQLFPAKPLASSVAYEGEHTFTGPLFAPVTFEGTVVIASYVPEVWCSGRPVVVSVSVTKIFLTRCPGMGGKNGVEDGPAEFISLFELADMSQKRSCGGRDVGRAWAAYGQWFDENDKAAQQKVAATAPVVRRMIKDSQTELVLGLNYGSDGCWISPPYLVPKGPPPGITTTPLRSLFGQGRCNEPGRAILDLEEAPHKLQTSPWLFFADDDELGWKTRCRQFPLIPSSSLMSRRSRSLVLAHVELGTLSTSLERIQDVPPQTGITTSTGDRRRVVLVKMLEVESGVGPPRAGDRSVSGRMQNEISSSVESAAHDASGDTWPVSDERASSIELALYPLERRRCPRSLDFSPDSLPLIHLPPSTPSLGRKTFHLVAHARLMPPLGEFSYFFLFCSQRDSGGETRARGHGSSIAAMVPETRLIASSPPQPLTHTAAVLIHPSRNASRLPLRLRATRSAIFLSRARGWSPRRWAAGDERRMRARGKDGYSLIDRESGMAGDLGVETKSFSPRFLPVLFGNNADRMNIHSFITPLSSPHRASRLVRLLTTHSPLSSLRAHVISALDGWGGASAKKALKGEREMEGKEAREATCSSAKMPWKDFTTPLRQYTTASRTGRSLVSFEECFTNGPPAESARRCSLHTSRTARAHIISAGGAYTNICGIDGFGEEGERMRMWWGRCKCPDAPRDVVSPALPAVCRVPTRSSSWCRRPQQAIDRPCALTPWDCKVIVNAQAAAYPQHATSSAVRTASTLALAAEATVLSK
ncbi:hypothetical protein C8R45DRAFT_1163488 [Mycena sanguinolenta]|nr:hypothetical protein C8R45DRAFT_1163488 [Mycena sanguinolenta]